MSVWAILIEKSNGATICFQVYEREHDAERVAEQLRAVSCACRVQRIRAGSASPGCTMIEPRRRQVRAMT